MWEYRIENMKKEVEEGLYPTPHRYRYELRKNIGQIVQ